MDNNDPPPMYADYPLPLIPIPKFQTGRVGGNLDLTISQLTNKDGCFLGRYFHHRGIT
jgi:hypothetical protein